MKKMKETYSMELNENLYIELELYKNGSVVITRAEEFNDELGYDEIVYCKPNIQFTIIPTLDLKSQIQYHLGQRDRINRIHNKIEKTRSTLRERRMSGRVLNEAI